MERFRCAREIQRSWRSVGRAGDGIASPAGWVKKCAARGARRVTRAVDGTLRSRAPPHGNRGESDFHAGNAIVTALSRPAAARQLSVEK